MLVTPKCALWQTVKTPNEMPPHAAFWQGLHCLLSPSQFSEKEIQFHLENITCDPFDIHWTIANLLYRERSDSVVEWTRDRGVVGSSLNGGTVLCP